MTGPIGFAEVAAAVKVRWGAAGLGAVVRGGVFAFRPPEGTKRPYAIVEGLGDVPALFTSKHRYDDVTFTVEVVADDLEAARPLVVAVRGALGEDALAVTTDNGAALLKLFPGKVTYIDEANYLRCICEFTAKVKQDRSR